MTESERFKIVRKELGFSQEAFATALGMKQGSVSDIERGKVGVSDNIKYQLRKLFKVNIEFIEFGKGEMFSVPRSKDVSVPVLNVEFTAGNIEQIQDFTQEIIGHVDMEGFKKCIAFVRVRGNSMFPLFTAGDFIGLEPQYDLEIIEYGQAFGIVTKTGERMVKTIRKGKDDDHLILRSSNKEYDDINIHKSRIDKLYKVRGPLRNQFY